MRWLVGCALVVLVGACGGGEQPPPKDAAKEPAPGALTLDNLDGKVFVQVAEGSTGDQGADVRARATFYRDGDTLKAKYTTAAALDVYTYTCTKKGDELGCWADKPKPDGFCKALIANEKECTAEAVAQLTGLKAEAIAAEIKETKDKIAKASPADRSKMREAFSAGGQPLRGVMHVRVKKDGQHIGINDMYQVMTNGQLVERQNVVGQGTFAETKRKLVFDECPLSGRGGLVIVASPDDKSTTTMEGTTVGATVTARFVGSANNKAEAGCTYTADTYAGYEQLVADKSITDAGGKLDWSFQGQFSRVGMLPMHLVQHKKCGDKPVETNVACQMINVR